MARPSDEEIEAAVIGGPTVHDDTIHLADYDESWPQLFDREADRIRTALGAIALDVEHVGSTSVPGLAAKPIIDIVLTVPDSSDEASYVAALERAGYVLRIREPWWSEHRLFNGPDTEVNVHVFSAGCPEVDHMVNFRDHLRVDDGDRELYERTKRDLAGRRWKYVQHYANAKSEVIAEIMTRADRPHRNLPTADPDTTAVNVARDELSDDPTVDITTTGRRSGLPRTIEIWMLDVDGRFYITGTPGRRDWLANLRADPRLVVHLKRRAGIDVDATAVPVTDPVTRRRVLDHVSADWYRTQTPIDELMDLAPMVEVRFT